MFDARFGAPPREAAPAESRSVAARLGARLPGRRESSGVLFNYDRPAPARAPGPAPAVVALSTDSRRCPPNALQSCARARLRPISAPESRRRRCKYNRICFSAAAATRR
ncbi:hypothetical protein A8H37_32435 [Burkholderia thailandensis]|nr:hypothetical protein A8H37_32435 [Burkholderia thailandensis]